MSFALVPWAVIRGPGALCGGLGLDTRPCVDVRPQPHRKRTLEAQMKSGGGDGGGGGGKGKLHHKIST